MNLQIYNFLVFKNKTKNKKRKRRKKKKKSSGKFLHHIFFFPDDDMILDMPEGYRTPGSQMNDLEPGQTTMSPHLVPGHPPGPPHISFLHGTLTQSFAVEFFFIFSVLNKFELKFLLKIPLNHPGRPWKPHKYWENVSRKYIEDIYPRKREKICFKREKQKKNDVKKTFIEELIDC